jgi:phosphate starvation-inducible PhoH-like protein
MYILYIAMFFMNFLVNMNKTNGFSVYRNSGSLVKGKGIIRNNNNRKLDCHMRVKKRVTESTDFTIGDTSKTALRPLSPVYNPRTQNQKKYVKYLGESDTKIVLGVGAAGSGKTLFACYSAIQELRQGTVTKIIMTRPVVPVEEEEIGFLPGSLINKMDPWTRPIFDILLEFYCQRDIDAMLNNGVIEISPLAFMRGRTFKRSFIIADEMQNSSPNQMLMLTTRLGDGSKMVITGDLKQSDRGVNNGLADLLQKLKSYDMKDQYNSGNSNKKNNLGIKYVELESEDVQRSAIVSQILDIYAGKPMWKTAENTTYTVVTRPVIDITCNQTIVSDENIVKSHTLSHMMNRTISSVIINDANISTCNKYSKMDNSDAALIPINHMSKWLNERKKK